MVPLTRALSVELAVAQLHPTMLRVTAPLVGAFEATMLLNGPESKVTDKVLVLTNLARWKKDEVTGNADLVPVTDLRERAEPDLQTVLLDMVWETRREGEKVDTDPLTEAERTVTDKEPVAATFDRTMEDRAVVSAVTVLESVDARRGSEVTENEMNCAMLAADFICKVESETQLEIPVEVDAMDAARDQSFGPKSIPESVTEKLPEDGTLVCAKLLMDIARSYENDLVPVPAEARATVITMEWSP